MGFGGSCFQKDILNLVYLCESFGLDEVRRGPFCLVCVGGGGGCYWGWLPSRRGLLEYSFTIQ